MSQPDDDLAFDEAPAGENPEPESRPGGIPLYVWVIAAVLLAIPVGIRYMNAIMKEP